MRDRRRRRSAAFLDALAAPEFVAQFTSDCARCGTVIETGDPVGAITGDGYEHVRCPDTPTYEETDRAH